jgi:excisionase family DNA binding protein
MSASIQNDIYIAKLISAGEAAKILGVKESTLSQQRWRGCKSLPWVKLGKSVRYKLSDIDAYIERNTIGKGA